ncbi:hypothetical protein L1987_14370 [Smallanthus sonchifolius]|uniref:Uncharacterized protein n=1 Tax=Smallanthus sonchifolius TaxID=185202 RepID=A0ACB9J4T3_9ASTR|nr:hypothetical protein L1987_14370 [Smallanthus sonchifolius]
MALDTKAHEVIFEEITGARKVILNRPKKLNSLNYEMLRKMYEKLKAYENDPTVKLIILKVFVMPEVLIGLFPDVGASYFLS